MSRSNVADMLLAELPFQVQFEQYTACTTPMSKLSLQCNLFQVLVMLSVSGKLNELRITAVGFC